MSRIDDQIREALRAEDADIFADGPEQSLHEMVIASFRGKQRWLVITMFCGTFVYVGLAIVVAMRFFQVETTRAMIGYATAFIFCLTAVGLMKVWYWMQLDKNAILREVKRLELQVARLSARR